MNIREAIDNALRTAFGPNELGDDRCYADEGSVEYRFGEGAFDEWYIDVTVGIDASDTGEWTLTHFRCEGETLATAIAALVDAVRGEMAVFDDGND